MAAKKTHRPLVCVSVSGPTPKSQSASASQAFEEGADLVEFRIDRLRTTSSDAISRHLVPHFPRAIVTVRSREEGGVFLGSEESRVTLIRRLASMGPAWVDVELFALERDPQILGSGTQTIASTHYHNGTPTSDRLRNSCSKARKLGFTPKVVATANSVEDNLSVLSLYDGESDAPIAFCMGEKGVFSRVMAMELGSPIAYCSLSGNGTASGQPTLRSALALRRSLYND